MNQPIIPPEEMKFFLGTSPDEVDLPAEILAYLRYQEIVLLSQRIKRIARMDCHHSPEQYVVALRLVANQLERLTRGVSHRSHYTRRKRRS